MTGLVVDGEFLCASHASRVKEGARFKPDPSRVVGETDEWGMPTAMPANAVAPPLCQYCGEPRHRGMCAARVRAFKKAKNAAEARGAGVLPAAVPATEIAIVSPPATKLPVPEPPSFPTEEIRFVPLESVPLRQQQKEQSALDRIFQAVLSAPAGRAVEMRCADAKAARSIANQVNKKGTRAHVQGAIASGERHALVVA